ncbi:MAG TPA: 1-deoxy-D-xylulose-5-phosphate reductoisomerase [Thermoanaerobaculia bacterium]|nr:1-deoxy-D-xylulose-5-phosphate reductoisomerase [Thermoanaerobaculia bacterium]
MSQQLALLGATGSIGASAVEVVRHHPGRLAVRALAAHGHRLEELAALARELRVPRVAVYDETALPALRALLPPGTEALSGMEGLVAVATDPEVDRVVAAMVGAAGLEPVHAALAAGKDVALANKESLVVAGGLLTALAARTGAAILPLDSEHVALHQALRAGAPEEVSRLVLTASGGPFLHRDEATWEAIRPAEALRHPTWKMGPKITVDSATLMNKGLELIEASHLFALPPERIDVVVHPQSIVHSLVEYRDGSWIAQLAGNEMVFPIQYALAYPERWENTFPRLDLAALGQLTFLALDDRRFPSVRMARQALAAGPSAPAVLNAANEEAVAAFLADEIPFPAIFDSVAEVLDRHRPEPVATLASALAWDAWGRRAAKEVLARHRRPR